MAKPPAPAASARTGDPNADPIVAAAPRIMKHMNDDHAASLLLFAWRLASPPLPNATIATMTAINSCGFELRCLLASGEDKWTRIAFARPLRDPKEARQALVVMHDACSVAAVPGGPLPKGVLAFYILVALGWYERGPDPLPLAAAHASDVLGAFIHYVPSRDFIAKGMLAFFGAHLIEALAVCHVMYHRLKFPPKVLPGWFALTIVFGYPMSSMMLSLKRVAKSGYKVKMA
jgi:hypothetical protein